MQKANKLYKNDNKLWLISGHEQMAAAMLTRPSVTELGFISQETSGGRRLYRKPPSVDGFGEWNCTSHNIYLTKVVRRLSGKTSILRILLSRDYTWSIHMEVLHLTISFLAGPGHAHNVARRASADLDPIQFQ
jgi:hypothetical protein